MISSQIRDSLKSPQCIFNYVVNHLRFQGKKSERFKYKNTKYCYYRGDNGTSCAIGCLISDEEYKPEIEELSINKIYFIFNDLKTIEWFHSNENLLFSLQRVHDHYPIENWEWEFHLISIKFGIQVQPPFYI